MEVFSSIVFFILFAESTARSPGSLTTTSSATATTKIMSLDDEPNPPAVWPDDSVKIFRDTDETSYIQKEIEATQDPYQADGTTFTCDKHFSSERTALLFAPGTYHDLDIEIGYYVQLAGLGVKADDVKFVGGKGPYVPALNKHLHKRIVKNENGQDVEENVGTCLDSFWRSAENFALHGDLQWAVSQAAPLRRVHVQGDVYLHDEAAYASGGHFANAIVDGKLFAGGQQQYLIRHVDLGQGASGGAWSMVYVGCSGKVPDPTVGTEKTASVTVVEHAPVRIEKPFIAMKPDLKEFELRVPMVMRKDDNADTDRPLLDGSREEVRDFTRVRVVREQDPVSRIQDALDQGKDVVLSPGIFKLDKTIELRKPGQIILGLGLATLEAPRDGSPCIHVSPGVPGIRIAGLMLEATEKTSTTKTSSSGDSIKSSLLEWGDEGLEDPGNRNNPGALFDMFVRVGGATAGNRANFAVDAMLRIHSGNVVGDNLWIWRADHSVIGPGEESNYPHISPVFMQTEEHEYRAETGIEVAGDDVTMYGLAVEHANGHQTIWSGERGAVHFYQCEFPYGVSRKFGDRGFRGYLVMEDVDEHEVYAPGIYSNFRNDNVRVSTAIEHPEKEGIKLYNPFIVKLDNNGGIDSIANGKGEAADTQGIPVRQT